MKSPISFSNTSLPKKPVRRNHPWNKMRETVMNMHFCKKVLSRFLNIRKTNFQYIQAAGKSKQPKTRINRKLSLDSLLSQITWISSMVNQVQKPGLNLKLKPKLLPSVPF